MKRLNNFARRNGLALLAGLVLTIAFGAREAEAQQSARPFVDCVEQEYAGGAATSNYIAYFGYSDNDSSSQVFPAGGSNNYFLAASNRVEPQNKISVAYPGVHPRVVSVIVPIGTRVTWIFGVSTATAAFQTNHSTLCSADGANSRLITYQGRLSDGGAAANGVYDLQFQLFNSVTGGTARTTLITLDNVSVANGVFTVQLDLGAMG